MEGGAVLFLGASQSCQRDNLSPLCNRYTQPLTQCHGEQQRLLSLSASRRAGICGAWRVIPESPSQTSCLTAAKTVGLGLAGRLQRAGSTGISSRRMCMTWRWESRVQSLGDTWISLSLLGAYRGQSGTLLPGPSGHRQPHLCPWMEAYPGESKGCHWTQTTNPQPPLLNH